MKNDSQPDPLRDALKQFIREKRIRGVQRHDRTIALVTDVNTADQLAKLGLVSSPIRKATRAALSDMPLELGEQSRLIRWEGQNGMLEAFGGLHEAMQAIEGITLVPYTHAVVNETVRGLGDSALIAQQGGRVGISSNQTVRGR